MTGTRIRSCAAILLCAGLLMGLCACAALGNSRIEADESTFLVDVRVDCDDVAGVHCEYYLADRAIGGRYAVNANGEMLLRGDVLTQDFTAEDFPAGADLTAFTMEIFVVDASGAEHACDGRVSFPAGYGRTYTVALEGSFDSGFAARLSG